MSRYGRQEVVFDAGSTLKKGQYGTPWDLVKVWLECASHLASVLSFISGKEMELVCFF